MSHPISPMPAAGPHPSSLADVRTADALFSKITRRLIPLLFLCYVLANIDRVNISIAQLQMKTALGFSDTVYGLGAGVFFLSYFLFEVPSNLLMTRIGARRTLALIMACWGVVSTCTMFVHTPQSFYLVRFLLGVFEAGFYPGVLFYLTRWYPSTRRTRAFGIFSSALAVSNVIGGLVSGWIVKGMDGVAGLQGWQWLFPLEGLPCVVLGWLLLVWLDERADHADWLTDTEKRALADEMQAESDQAQVSHDFAHALRQPLLYGFALVYFAMICAIAILTFWLPTIIHGLGMKDIAVISMLSAIPAVVAAAAMILVAAHAQRTRDYRWHLALAAFIGTAALVCLPAVGHHLVPALLLLCVATGSIFSTVPVFWGLASAHFKGSAAAGGIALISSLGLIGAFLSPSITGWLKTATGTLTSSLYAHAAVLALGGVIALLITARSAAAAKRA